MQPSGQPHPFSIVDHVIISLLDIASLPSVFYFNVPLLPQSNIDIYLLVRYLESKGSIYLLLLLPTTINILYLDRYLDN